MHTVVAGWGDLGRRVGRRLTDADGRATGLRRTVDPADEASVVACDLGRVEPGALAHLAADRLVICLAPDARTPEAYRAVYRDAALRAIDALAAPGRVLFVSSTAVYGESGEPGAWIDEDSPTRPSRWQGELLLEAEEALRERVPALIVARAAGLYGPGRNWMLRRARAGETGASRWTNRIHIEDAAAAIVHVLALENPAPVYLLADGAPVGEARLLAALRAEMGMDVAAQPDPDATMTGRRIRPARLLDSGFAFAYPDFLAGYRALLRQAGVVGL